jgi:hypothetical protein
MSTTLDGQALFDEQQLEIKVGSFSRGRMERAVAGLDGVVSIDLGERDRKITQKGELRAVSRSQISERIGAISGSMDGDTHTLVTDSGEEFDNLRVDSFRVTRERVSGGGMAIDYEIVYTQLAV